MSKNLTEDEWNNLIRDRKRTFYGEQYVDACMSKLDCSELVQLKLSKFVKEPKNFLVYCGGPGIGKTYFCASLTHWIMETFGNNWMYWNENKLLKKLRDSMDTTKGDYLDCLQSLIDHDLVILDDIGSGVKINEWREEILFNFIDYRYNSMKPTIVTSNFSKKDFLETYHSRIHSRLFAKENTIIEVVSGKDKRMM